MIIVATCFLYLGLQGGSYLFILTCTLMLKILLAMCCPSSDLKHLGFIHHLILRDETDGHPSNYDFSQLNFQGIIYQYTNYHQHLQIVGRCIVPAVMMSPNAAAIFSHVMTQTGHISFFLYIM